MLKKKNNLGPRAASLHKTPSRKEKIEERKEVHGLHGFEEKKKEKRLNHERKKLLVFKKSVEICVIRGQKSFSFYKMDIAG